MRIIWSYFFTNIIFFLYYFSTQHFFNIDSVTFFIFNLRCWSNHFCFKFDNVWFFSNQMYLYTCCFITFYDHLWLLCVYYLQGAGVVGGGGVQQNLVPQHPFASFVPSQVSPSLIHVEPSGHVSSNKRMSY